MKPSNPRLCRRCRGTVVVLRPAGCHRQPPPSPGNQLSSQEPLQGTHCKILHWLVIVYGICGNILAGSRPLEIMQQTAPVAVAAVALLLLHAMLAMASTAVDNEPVVRGHRALVKATGFVSHCCHSQVLDMQQNNPGDAVAWEGSMCAAESRSGPKGRREALTLVPCCSKLRRSGSTEGAWLHRPRDHGRAQRDPGPDLPLATATATRPSSLMGAAGHRLPHVGRGLLSQRHPRTRLAGRLRGWH